MLWKEWPDVPHSSGGRYQFLAITNLSLNSWYEFQVTPVLRNQQEGIVTGNTSPMGGPYRTLCAGNGKIQSRESTKDILYMSNK